MLAILRKIIKVINANSLMEQIMENALRFEKEVKGGVIYCHQWATGHQLLMFPDHAYAKHYARKNNWDYKGA